MKLAKWWSEKPMRLIQTNLREIDVLLDSGRIIDDVKGFSANVLLINVGGIVANYPTKLEYHYRNPLMKNDFTKEVIERAHEAGIKVIARFDFSKINELSCTGHPEWLYKSVDGKYVDYNGQIHTCVNGAYQQEYAIHILEEVIDNYPVDGVFFNMIGYITNDYSGNYHGICQCDNCRSLFYQRYGHELPTKEDGNDPIFRKYVDFKSDTCKELFNKIADFIKSKKEDIAICTYTNEGVDIYRKESNTALDRPLPEWNYSAGDNVKSVLNSWDDKVVSNSAVHFVDIPYRHSSVYPDLTYLRLVQNIAAGGWLDYYVIGTLGNQDDRMSLAGVRDLYHFHKENETYYTNLKSLSDVCLIVPGLPGYSPNEYKGIYRMLSEANILFDAIEVSAMNMPESFAKLKEYKIVILPGLNNMNDALIKMIDSYVEEGGHLIATGATSTCDGLGNPLGSIRLKCTGINSIKRVIEKAGGTYFRIRPADKAAMKGFDDLDIVYLDSVMMECDIADGARGYLGFIPACMFGPPEKCYYTTETDVPGIILNKFGKGKCAFVPWEIGSHYERLSYHGHKMLFESVLSDLLGLEKSLIMEKTPMLEVTVHKEKDGKWQLLNLVNLSGQLGTAFHPCICQRDISIKLRTGQKPSKVHILRQKRILEFEMGDDGFVKFIIPEMDLFETVVCELQ